MTLASDFERAAGRVPAEAAPTASVSVSEPPRLSVALASRNRRETLERALDSLAAQTYPSDRFEVIVVLDGSTDDSAELVRARDFPTGLTLVEQEHQGLSAARNRGAATAANEVLVFTDDDILLDERCLERYSDAQARGGPAHVVLGSAWPEVGADVWSETVREWWVRHYETKAEPGHRWTFVDVGDGMACLPRALHLEIGGFDERFRERRQDWEWGIRLFARGARFTQLLDAHGLHLVDTGIPTALRYARQEGRSDVQLGEKHPAVRGRLLLSRFAEGAAAKRAHRLYRHRAAPDAAARAAALAADALKNGRARRLAGHLFQRLRVHAYLAGVRDALGPDVRALDDFLEPVRAGDDAHTLVVELTQPRPVQVPPVGGRLDLSVREQGRELAAVRAIEPGGQWDWDDLTARVVATALNESAHPAAS